jgi:hypothetical protein
MRRRIFGVPREEPFTYDSKAGSSDLFGLLERLPMVSLPLVLLA